MLDKNPLVSIIVPMFNVEKYVNKCIESVLKQSYSNIEVLVINDGSTDSSRDRVKEYMHDNRLKILDKTNGGLMSAWIFGCNYVTGSYIMFVDSDDWISDNCVELLVNEALNSNAEIVVANFSAEFQDGTSLNVNHKINAGIYTNNMFQTELFPYLFYNTTHYERGIYLSRWAKVFKAEVVFSNIKFCNTEVSLGEDVNFLFPAILSSKRICVLKDQFIYKYRQISSSMMRTYDKNMIEKLNLLKSTLLDINKLSCTFDFSKNIQFDYANLVLLYIKRVLIHEKLTYKKTYQYITKNSLIEYESMKSLKTKSIFDGILLFLLNWKISCGFIILNVYFRHKKRGRSN